MDLGLLKRHGYRSTKSEEFNIQSVFENRGAADSSS